MGGWLGLQIMMHSCLGVTGQVEATAYRVIRVLSDDGMASLGRRKEAQA